jgi:hypothetical protein
MGKFDRFYIHDRISICPLRSLRLCGKKILMLMATISYKPTPYNSHRYRLEPTNWITEVSLKIVLCYGNLPTVARAALERQGFGETDRGFGLEYSTRADKVGFVRWWRWDWRERKDKTGGYRIKTRKFYIPEPTYLGVLVGVLRAHDLILEANAIVEQMPCEEIVVEFIPSIYDYNNYRIEPYDREYRVCLVQILETGNLQQARDRPPNYAELQVSEAVYLEVLDRLFELHSSSKQI